MWVSPTYVHIIIHTKGMVACYMAFQSLWCQEFKSNFCEGQPGFYLGGGDQCLFPPKNYGNYGKIMVITQVLSYF